MYEFTQIVNSIPGLPGPPGPPGPPGVGATQILRTIPALTVEESDANIAISLKGLFYRISAETDDKTKSKTLLCTVTNNSTFISDQVGFKVGNLNLGIENIIILGQHKLRIYNNETQPINVTIYKEIF